MQVSFGAQPEQIPADTLANFHRRHRHAAKEVPIDRVLVIGFDEAGILAIQRGPLLRELGNIVVEVPRLVFIKNVEQRDKFPIHPGRRAIRLAGASRRDNDCADEPRIGIAH